MKYHLPSPGRAAGRKGIALCGRWARYFAGDHDLLRFIARQSVAQGKTAHYCKQCLRKL